MRRSFDQSEFTQPGAEFNLPPEQSATLHGGRHFTDRFGAPSRTLAEPGEAEEQILGPVPEEGPGEAPKEEAPSSAEQDMKQTAERQTKRKRSLLLQFAAAAASVSLVTTSFGIDLLGMDGLFNDSVIIGEVSHDHDNEYEPTHDSEPEQIFGDLISFGGDRIFPRLSNEWTTTQAQMVDAHNRYIATAEFTQGSMGEQAMVDAFVWSDRKDPQFFTGPIPMSFPGTKVSAESSSIYYNENTNTLTLNNYHGKGLMINNMGQDFTIRLEGDNRLDEYLLVGGGSLTVTGSGGIVINENEDFDYGILLAGQWSEACLMIDEEVKFDISGRYSVLRVSATCADKPMWHKSYSVWTNIFQGQMRDENTSPIKDDPNHYYSWLMCGEGRHSTIVHMNNGYHPGGADQPTEPGQTEPEPVTEAPVTVTRMPVGGDSSFPMLPNPMPNSVGLDGTYHESSILMWENYAENSFSNDLNIFSYQQNHPTGRDDIYYDPSENTLTLNNYTGGKLYIRNMGSNFKIRLIGRNELYGGIEITGDLTSGSITFTGDGYLAVNTAGTQPYGILADAGEASACIMIDSSVIMDIYGSTAVTVLNTTADKGIYYKSDSAVSGLMQESDKGEKGTTLGNTVYDWKSVDTQGNPVSHIHIGGEAPLETEPPVELPGLPVGGDSSYPDLPNPNPNTPVPSYGVLNEDYVMVLDNKAGTSGFIYLNPNLYTEQYVTQQGISYDPSTNTLTLDNYHGGGLSVNLMGNGFTVELIGENELTEYFMIWGFYTGGSVHFTGNGSLTVNSGVSVDIGLQLAGEFSTSCIMIDSSVTLDVYGKSRAVEIQDTDAEKAVYLLSGDPLDNVRQLTVTEEFSDNDLQEPKPYYIWRLVDNDGKAIKHLHIEGSGSILDWFGR